MRNSVDAFDEEIGAMLLKEVRLWMVQRPLPEHHVIRHQPIKIWLGASDLDPSIALPRTGMELHMPTLSTFAAEQPYMSHGIVSPRFDLIGINCSQAHPCHDRTLELSLAKGSVTKIETSTHVFIAL